MSLVFLGKQLLRRVRQDGGLELPVGISNVKWFMTEQLNELYSREYGHRVEDNVGKTSSNWPDRFLVSHERLKPVKSLAYKNPQQRLVIQANQN